MFTYLLHQPDKTDFADRKFRVKKYNNHTTYDGFLFLQHESGFVYITKTCNLKSQFLLRTDEMAAFLFRSFHCFRKVYVQRLADKFQL
jgi:hypothetical protein